MFTLKKTFICPYCFNTSNISDIEFRCTNHACDEIDDLPYTRYHKEDEFHPRKGKPCFKSKSRNLKAAKCPECNKTTNRIVCPECHNPIPKSSLTGKDMIISIVGTVGAGKTNYIGVLIHELRKTFSSWGGNLKPAFADTDKMYKRDFETPLYIKKQALDKTSVDLGVIVANEPLIFTLSFTKFMRVKRYTLVFFDTAGENVDNSDAMIVNNYICKSAGIIFLLDPSKIPEVIKKYPDVIDKAGADGITATDSGDIISNVADLIKAENGWSEHKKVSIPVATVFAKFDAIKDIVEESGVASGLFDESPHRSLRAFDEKDKMNVNRDVVNLLLEWEADQYTSSLDTSFTNYSYFIASAIGLDNEVTRAGMGLTLRTEPEPHRVEDAFLWLLSENHVIPNATERKVGLAKNLAFTAIGALTALIIVWLAMTFINPLLNPVENIYDYLAVNKVGVMNDGYIDGSNLQREGGTIVAAIGVTDNSISSQGHNIRAKLEVMKDGNRQEIAEFDSKASFHHNNGKDTIYELFTYDKFVPLDMYYISIFVDDELVHEAVLYG